MTNETDPLINTSSLKAESEKGTKRDQHTAWHLKTYTAGEDASRLAAAAKEMGLNRIRAARPQVRRRQLLTTLERAVFEERKEHNIWETVAGVAGNILEWYDFAVFGYFGDIIGEVFFPPNQSGHTATMESFAVFGGAFLARPLGGLFLGYLGDVYGRKKALTVSIFLMAFPTFAMGCLPSYEQVGYISTVLLIIIRLLQGMSVGGQLMSSLIFTLESVPHEQWGLYGSFVWATGNLGVLLGSIVGYAIRTSFSREELVKYGWRIPFLSGIVVSIAGFYLRSSEDSGEENGRKEEGDKTQGDRTLKQNPLQAMFATGNLRPLLASAMVPMLWSSGFYLSFVWMAVYMTDLVDSPVPHAFAVNSTALLGSVVLFFPFAGWLSDKYGRRTIMSIGGASIAVLAPFLIEAIGKGDSWLSFGSQMFLGMCLSFWGSPMGAWLTESFEPEARLTSVATGYNTAHAIVGGSTPAVATYLVDAAGPTSPGWIYVIISCIAMAGLWMVAPPPPPISSSVASSMPVPATDPEQQSEREPLV